MLESFHSQTSVSVREALEAGSETQREHVEIPKRSEGRNAQCFGCRRARSYELKRISILFHAFFDGFPKLHIDVEERDVTDQSGILRHVATFARCVPAYVHRAWRCALAVAIWKRKRMKKLL